MQGLFLVFIWISLRVIRALVAEGHPGDFTGGGFSDIEPTDGKRIGSHANLPKRLAQGCRR